MFFYKSPSLNIRDRVFMPLRRISAIIIKKDVDVLKFSDVIV